VTPSPAVRTALDRLIDDVRSSLRIDTEPVSLRPLPDVDSELQEGVETEHTVDLPDGLRFASVVTRRPGSVEWRSTLTNSAAQRSALLSDLRPLDLTVDVGAAAPVVHHAKGSQCKVDDFEPIVETLGVGDRLHLEPNGGRSSDGVFPFFAVALGGGDVPAVAIAVGWTGQWCADIERDDGRVRITAGLACARLRLEPGESISLPTILATVGTDATAAAAVTRSTVLEHYLPRRDGNPPTPIAHMTMATFHRTHQTSEPTELAAVEAAADLGMEAFWVDASWYGDTGNWSAEVGNWYVRTSDFPNGLRPISDAAHARGMRFVWWIEPERARAGTRLPTEHPDFYLGFPDDPGTLLLDLGNPAARDHILDLTSGFIAEFGVDVYRQDFNVPPLPAWLGADEQDRTGIHEIRHVEGLYWLWDQLLARHPGLLIDNCASGGRRIDLETTRRSVSLWRSDAADVGGGATGDAVSVANQVQCGGLTEWVGYHTGPVWGFTPYEIRSALATGFVVYCPLPDDVGAMTDLRAAVAEIQRLRPSMSSTFRRLGPSVPGDDGWAAVQFHDPDGESGFAVVYRRPACPLDVVPLELEHIDPDAAYDVEIRPSYAPTDAIRFTGADLQTLHVDLPTAPAAVLIEYTRANGRH
jgi:alpha-galactosidase